MTSNGENCISMEFVQVFIALIQKLIFSFYRFTYARMGRKGVNAA